MVFAFVFVIQITDEIFIFFRSVDEHLVVTDVDKGSVAAEDVCISLAISVTLSPNPCFFLT